MTGWGLAKQFLGQARVGDLAKLMCKLHARGVGV